jgi:phage FluMu protein Com
MMFNFIQWARLDDRSRATLRSVAAERRCACGSLLARLCADGVELKCRRCKRVVVIPWQTSATWHGVTVDWDAATSGG